MLTIMVRSNAILKSEFVNTERKVKIENNKLTMIQEHLLSCNYSPSYEGFSILARENNDFKMKIMESLLTARDNPCLNKQSGFLFTFRAILTYHQCVWCPSTHCAYTIVVCLVFSIMLGFLCFLSKKKKCMSI